MAQACVGQTRPTDSFVVLFSAALTVSGVEHHVKPPPGSRTDDPDVLRARAAPCILISSAVYWRQNSGFQNGSCSFPGAKHAVRCLDKQTALDSRYLSNCQNEKQQCHQESSF